MSGASLAGCRVLVTRPQHQAQPLVELLRARGATVECQPTIRLRDPDDPAPLLRAAARLGDYDWAVFTSMNGVERFEAALAQQGVEASAFDAVRWAAIGPATARAIHGLGIRLVHLPSSYRAEALAEAIRESEPEASIERPLDGRSVLVARAAGARPVLVRRLRSLGALVEEVAAYTTEPNTDAAESLRAATLERPPDWITFTASSAVSAFCELGGTIGEARVAVIGPITATTARRLGVPVDAVASEYTIPGLVHAIVSAEGASGADGPTGEAAEAVELPVRDRGADR